MLQPTIFELLLDSASRGRRLREVEDEQLGFTHAELGGLLAERWRYPLSLILVIMGHDDERPTGMSAVVQIADLLARDAGIGVEAPELISPELAAETGVDPDAARDRLAPLFQTESRQPGAAADEPRSGDAEFADALDAAGV